LLPFNPSTFDAAQRRVKGLIKNRVVGCEVDVIFDILHLKEVAMTNLRYKYFIINCLQKCFINISNAYFSESN